MTDNAHAPQPSAHHYVPGFYLKGFTDKEGTLWVYEKRKPPRASSPKHEAQRPDYYAFQHGVECDSKTESELAKAESLVAPIFRKIANPQFRMNEVQGGELLSFIAMMFVRVPAWREFLNKRFAEIIKHTTQQQARDAERFYAEIRQMEEDTGIKIDDVEKLRQFALSGNYEVTQESDGFNLRMMFESAVNISEVLVREHGYEVLYAPRDLFYVTCDNPVVTIRPDSDGTAFVGMGFGWPDTEVLVPLNKRACLLLRRRAKGTQVEATQRRVEQINTLIMAVAQTYLYAPVGHRRLSRLFDERGCRVKYGENAFMLSPPQKSQINKLHNPKGRRRK